MIYTVLVTKRIRYRVEATSPDDAQQLAFLAAIGEHASRALGVIVEGRTLEVSRAEVLDTGSCPPVE